MTLFALNAAQIPTALDRQIESETQTLADWQAKLAKDPANTLSWGETGFEAAAHLKILREVKAGFEGGCTIEEAIETLQRDVLREASSPSRSTSDCANLMQRFLLAARAQILESLITIQKVIASTK